MRIKRSHAAAMKHAGEMALAAIAEDLAEWKDISEDLGMDDEDAESYAMDKTSDDYAKAHKEAYDSYMNDED